jgi:hypothetical protein
MSTNPEPDDLLIFHASEGAIIKSNTNGIDSLVSVNQLEVKPRMIRIAPEMSVGGPGSLLNSLGELNKLPLNFFDVRDFITCLGQVLQFPQKDILDVPHRLVS